MKYAFALLSVLGAASAFAPAARVASSTRASTLRMAKHLEPQFYDTFFYCFPGISDKFVLRSITGHTEIIHDIKKVTNNCFLL